MLTPKKNKIIYNNHTITKWYHTVCRDLFIETSIYKSLSHANITKFYGFGEYTTQLILQRECSTLAYIAEHNKISQTAKIDLLTQLSSALKYLHANDIMHLDLTCDNIMVTNGVVKLIDFGSSEYIYNNCIETVSQKCTATHRAPQLFNCEPGYYTICKKADVWSFGVVAIELFNACLIYKTPSFLKKSANDNQIYNYIQSLEFQLLINTIPAILRNCLCINASARPTFTEIYDNLMHLKSQISYCIDLVDNDKLVLLGNTMTHIDFNWCAYNDYYKNILAMCFKEYPLLKKSYPVRVIYCTHRLIHKLYLCRKCKIYIDNAILLCNNFLQSDYNFFIKNYINTIANNDVICDIINLVDGDIFI